MTRLFGFFTPHERRNHSGRKPENSKRRLFFEPLEDRRLLSVWGTESAILSVTDSSTMMSSFPQSGQEVPIILATSGLSALDAPTGFVATNSSTSENSNQITISWGAVTGAENGYSYRYKQAAESWTESWTAATATNCTFTVEAGTVYDFEVYAVETGENDQSEVGSFSFQMLSAPGSFSATQSDSSATAINLTWNPVTGAGGYKVFYPAWNGNMTSKTVDELDDPNSDLTLSPGSTVEFKVKATAPTDAVEGITYVDSDDGIYTATRLGVTNISFTRGEGNTLDIVWEPKGDITDVSYTFCYEEYSYYYHDTWKEEGWWETEVWSEREELTAASKTFNLNPDVMKYAFEIHAKPDESVTGNIFEYRTYLIAEVLNDPILEVTANNVNTIDISWQDNNGGIIKVGGYYLAPWSSYTLAYRAKNTQEWTVESEIDYKSVSKTLTNLEADTEYEIKIQIIASTESTGQESLKHISSVEQNGNQITLVAGMASKYWVTSDYTDIVEGHTLEDEWSYHSDINWFDEGTYATTEEYTISTAEELAGLAAIVNGTAVDSENNPIPAYNFSGKTVTLAADIDLAGRNWTPIGLQRTWSAYKWFFGNPNDPNDIRPLFAGTFDGGGYNISNLSITSIPSETYSGDDQFIGIGLFGTVAGRPDNLQNKDTIDPLDIPACLKNVTLVDAQVDLAFDSDIVNPLYIGILAGQAGKSVSLENCRITNSGQGESILKIRSEKTNGDTITAGSIIGMLNSSSMENCSSDADIDAETTTGHPFHVGGLFGQWANYASGPDNDTVSTTKYHVTDSVYNGDISVTSSNAVSVGGIGASAYVIDATIDGCITSGTIHATSTASNVKAGGIFSTFDGGTGPQQYAGSLTNCYSDMGINVSAQNSQAYVGGITGRIQVNGPGENLVKNNTFNGSITVEGTGEEITYCVGGIVGAVRNGGPDNDVLIQTNTVTSNVTIIVDTNTEETWAHTTTKDLAVGSLVGWTSTDATHTVTVKNIDIPTPVVTVGITSATTLYPTNLPVATVEKDGTTFEQIILNNLIVTTLDDVVNSGDTVNSLREAIAYAEASIEWTEKAKTDFSDSQFGYSFKTNEIVAFADMEDGEAYYTPTGYDGTAASIQVAIVHFDPSLATEEDLTILLNTELVISKTIAIDGKIGNQSVVIDRGLVEYHSEEWDIAKIYGTPDFDYDTVWTYSGTTSGEGTPTQSGRVMSITQTVPVALSNMTITGGYNGGVGTGINTAAELTLNNVDVKGNYSATSAKGVAINMTDGTLRMYGGSIEGNASGGQGSINVDIVSSDEESLFFDGVEVLNNSVGNGCFIESRINGGEIVINDAYIHDNDGNVFHGDGDSAYTNYTITESLIENNFGFGNLWFTSGIIKIENTIFDNSDYTYSDIYESYPQYLYGAAVSVYGGHAVTTDITFDNCLFKNVYAGLGSDGTKYHFDLDATFNNCTLTLCTDEGLSDWEAMYTSSSSEDVNITLNNTLILGSLTDFGNLNKTEGVTVTANNSIIGKFNDYNNDLTLTQAASIIERHEAGTIGFVQTNYPDAAGYFEAATAMVNGREIDLRGTAADGTTEYSIIGYNSKPGEVTGLTMAQVANDFYTTVTTLDDVVDETDGVISLREAIDYATTNIEWQGRQKSAFGDFDDYGYDFTTGKIIDKKDMVAGTLYYTPTGYDGSAESIQAAIVTFDASLAEGENDPKIMLTDDLTYDKAFAVDGKVGEKNVILDRGLYEYDDEFLNDSENFKTLITDESAIKNQIWKRAEGKQDQYGRILQVNAAVPVALSNMTLQGAAGKTRMWGAAIYVQGADLSMTNVSIKGNVQENGDNFGVVWCEAGSIHMVGGSVEGNYVNGWGMFYVKNVTDTLYFKDVRVTHNRATQGSFIESQYSENTIEIVNCKIIENKGNPIHVDSGDVDFIMTDTSFISNYGSDSLYFISGDSTFTNCIFDNTKFEFTGNDYGLPVMRLDVKTGELKQTYTNCLFNGMGFSIGKDTDSGAMDITLDHCTVTGCVNPNEGDTSNGIEIMGENYTLNLTLKDSILIGNDYDLVNNQETADKVNITTENSIVGYFKDETGTAEYETTDSIFEEKKAGSITFVQTEDPNVPGYYEAATATVYMYDWTRELDLRSTVFGTSEVYSILGYNSFVYDEEDPDRKLDTTMNDLVFEGDEYYTTVTTAEDISEDDGFISLREAVAYAKEMMPDGAQIYFSETLRGQETGDLSEIILKSDLTINSPITMNGLVGDDRISISFYSNPEIKMINNFYLNLSDINLNGFGLYAKEDLKPGSTCVSGTTSLNFFSGIDGEAAADGWLTVIDGSTLTITVFEEGDPDSNGCYVIHHVDADSSNPLHIEYNKGEVLGYQIGNDEDTTYSIDLLDVKQRTPNPETNYFYSEATPGTKVADILFFGNERLPVQSGQATFTVTCGEKDASNSFEWIYTPDTDDKEACGIRVKDDITLDAGVYTVSVKYVNLQEIFEFTVTANATVELENTEGKATPQDVPHTDIILTTGQALHFVNDHLVRHLSWNEDGDASDYFSLDADSSTGGMNFTLYYKGGLIAREEAYVVTIGVSNSQITEPITVTYSLTIVAPEISLDRYEGTITQATKKAELAEINITNLLYAQGEEINWKFILAEGPSDLFTAEQIPDCPGIFKLFYNKGEEELPDGTFMLDIEATDHVDTVTARYSLEILENQLVVDTIFSSIRTTDSDLDVARLAILNFPEGEIEYYLNWEVNQKDVYDYFEIVTKDEKTFIHYKAGLAEGEYTIYTSVACDPTNPDDGDSFSVWQPWKLEVTKPGAVAAIVLDPTESQMKTAEVMAALQEGDKLELASIQFKSFAKVPDITIQALNTTTKETKKDFSEFFTELDGKLWIVLPDETQELSSGEYSITVTATTYSNDNIPIQVADSIFTLTLYDAIVNPDVVNITIDFDTNTNEFQVKDTDDPENDPIEEGQANVLIIELKDTLTTPTITITQDALNNLGAIQIESDTDNNIEIQSSSSTVIGDHYIISSSNVYDSSHAVSLTLRDRTTNEQISSVTSSGTQNITISSAGNTPTQYDIETLSVDLSITPNAEDIVSFEHGTSGNGIVLNLNHTEYYQTVYTGQTGMLKLDGTVGGVILSSGNDIITGSAHGSTITDESDSWNTITLSGNDEAINQVALNSGSTIMVNGEAENKITVKQGDNTIINLSESTGPTTAEITGHNVAITGGNVKKVTLVGDSGIINSPESTKDMEIEINGNGAIVKTGSGNDKITIKGGSDSLINAGAGDDVIYIEGEASNNSISTGDGDDIVISTSTGGNTIHANGGNDFIIGGSGRDRIFGGTGYSLLAGGRDSDRIIGGSKRDIMIANITSNMENKSITDLLEIRRKIFTEKPWWESDANLNAALDVLGNRSVSDGTIDILSRESEDGIDIFFRNLSPDGDTISNNLELDVVLD